MIDRGEHDGSPFIVFEYVDGENLKQLVDRDGPLPVERALELAIEIARGLAFAHENGLRPPRRQAAERAPERQRRGEGDRLRHRALARGERGRDRRPAPCSARATTSRPSRRRAATSTSAPTSTRSASCSTSCSPARCRSPATTSSRSRCSTSTTPPPPVSLEAARRAARASTRRSRGRSRRSPAARFATMADFAARARGLPRRGPRAAATTAPRPAILPGRQAPARAADGAGSAGAAWPIAARARVLARGRRRGRRPRSCVATRSSRRTATGTAAPRRAPIAVTASASYDPDGDDQRERRPTCRSRPTATRPPYWSTETLLRHAELRHKPGVGLVLDAGSPVDARTAHRHLDTPGFTAVIQAGDSADAARSATTRRSQTGGREHDLRPRRQQGALLRDLDHEPRRPSTRSRINEVTAQLDARALGSIGG